MGSRTREYRGIGDRKGKETKLRKNRLGKELQGKQTMQGME